VTSRLIERCLCRSPGPFREFDAPTGLRVAECNQCGVLHQITEATRFEVEAQYAGLYHAATDRHPGCIPYKERYEHDLAIASRRWQRYEQLLNGQLKRRPFHMLDVGAANGAWVDFVQGQGLLAFGIDPDPAMTRGGVLCGTVRDVVGSFSLVTYHDVLEHIVDPRAELAQARGRTSVGGTIIVDVPDVFDQRGVHHFKPEHIWFFNEDALRSLLRQADFRPFLIDRPIPGKLVAYGEAIAA
jgi:methyltransferase family protein